MHDEYYNIYHVLYLLTISSFPFVKAPVFTIRYIIYRSPIYFIGKGGGYITFIHTTYINTSSHRYEIYIFPAYHTYKRELSVMGCHIQFEVTAF